jgi:hypothetical protein
MLKGNVFLSIPLLALTGCSCGTAISVSGSLRDGVVVSTKSGKRVTVTDLVIYEYPRRIPDNSYQWHIEGSAKTASVTYGKAPSGMQETVAAKPLEPGRTYMISVGVKASIGYPVGPPTCPGETSFMVNPDGTITVSANY